MTPCPPPRASAALLSFLQIDRHGLVNGSRLPGIVEEMAAAGEARALAQDIAQCGPVAVAVAKPLINAAEGEEHDAAVESIAGALASFSADGAEGVAR